MQNPYIRLYCASQGLEDGGIGLSLRLKPGHCSLIEAPLEYNLCESAASDLLDAHIPVRNAAHVILGLLSTRHPIRNKLCPFLETPKLGIHEERASGVHEDGRDPCKAM